MEFESVSTMIFSKGISVDPENNLNYAVVNPFVRLELPYIPTMFTMNVTSLVSPLDLRGKRSFELELRDPDGKVVVKMEKIDTNFENIDKNKDMDFNFKHGITNMSINKEGIYSCDLKSNNKVITSGKFIVSKEIKEV